jgi:DNA-binding NtrC family response regulator
MNKRRILIVDDERSVRRSLKEWFLEDGFDVETAEDGAHALQAMDSGPFDIFIVDLKMPGMDGITLLKQIQEGDKNATVIILTAYASVETAVDALKQGAFDYVTKPVDPDELSNLARNALRQRVLEEENLKLKERVSEMNLPMPIVGESPSMRRILETIRTVADTDSTVVVLGESGTGKELMAKAIHAQSKRRFAPIVAVNCGAIPETLLESELFGHEKGSFTGAQYRRKGKIELAHGGTLFLDEIGDITPKMQIDLLRVLETRSFTRLGGVKEVESDFRLVCATNRNLEKLVADGEFREDLYYRIKVFSVEIPPLRERREDILPLARHFVAKYARSMGKAEKDITPQAQEVMEGYRWPGNVRELENAIERAMVIGAGDEILPKDLPLQIEENEVAPSTSSLGAMEKDHIARVLQEMDGNVTRSAKVLGIDRATLYNKMKKYGIQR